MDPLLCQGAAAAAANWVQPVQQRSCSALCDYSCPDVCSPSQHWVSQKQMGNKPRGRETEKESGKKQE